MTSAAEHNFLFKKILPQIITETDGETDCFVLLESLIAGVMAYYRPDPRHAGEILDSMTIAVIERLKAK